MIKRAFLSTSLEYFSYVSGLCIVYSVHTCVFTTLDRFIQIMLEKEFQFGIHSGTIGSIPQINECNYVVRSEGHIVGPHEAQ